MELDANNMTEIIEVMENFLEQARPPEEVREKLDISYRIENQSVYIYTIRPKWTAPDQKMHSDVAKATYVKSNAKWKVYWLRGNLKWYPYDPPLANSIREFSEMVHQDPHHCFWG